MSQAEKEEGVPAENQVGSASEKKPVLKDEPGVPSPDDAESASAAQNSENEESGEGAASDRMQRLLELKDRLAHDSLRLARRFWMLIFFCLLGILVLSFLLKQIHYFCVGRYAVLGKVAVTQNSGNQGQLEISYEVQKPGRILCRRTSGNLQTDLIFDYREPCRDSQHWNWGYVPGEPIDVTLWSREGVHGIYRKYQFPTSDVVDVVILIDSTESMDESIQTLKEKCVEFASLLERQAVRPRFALIGFGDALQAPQNWIFQTDFFEDVRKFQEAVESIPRFEGGDLPESSLDALAAAIEKVKKDSAGHAIRFYLVTDQSFHPQTAAGNLTVESMAAELKKNRVMLEVFANPRFQQDYLPLIGDCGHFREIENFGEVLSQGRFLED